MAAPTHPFNGDGRSHHRVRQLKSVQEARARAKAQP